MEKKTETIIVRVTKVTKETLQKIADSLGIKLSEHIRNKLDEEK